MAEDTVHRRLTVVVSADVVAYSRLIGADEAGTRAALNSHRRELIDPNLAEHHGRLVSTAGDSLLAEFTSVVDAVQWAVEIQRGMKQRNAGTAEDCQIVFRVGINLGEVIVEGEDIHGDGVNVAARVQALAEPGGICISGKVFEEAHNRIDVGFEDLGEIEVKNIARPIHVFRVHPERAETADSGPSAAPALELPDKPSIAVLPFDNLSGDPEQEYFSDGITEDIITTLSRIRQFFVIARNTTFTYKGHAVNVLAVAKELGVRYVLEGSVRKAGNRVRISAQLIDGETGNHIWAERYDRDLNDIFAVQDEITNMIVARIEPEVGASERRRVARKPQKNLQAWECYHLGVFHFYKFTAEDNLEAQRLLSRSRGLDPAFGEAHAWWAYATILGMVYWDTEPESQLLDDALAAAKRALELDDQNAVFYTLLARVHLARCEYDTALTANEMAIKLSPTSAVGYCGLGDSLAYEGRYDESITKFERAISLSPNDPQRWAFLTYGALAMIFKEDFDMALDWAEQAIVIPNRQYWTIAHKAVALAHLSRLDEARQVVADLLAEKPGFTCALAERKLFYIKRAEQLTLYLDGLRKAGLPEG